MDLHVIYWEDTKNHAVTRYLDCSFMGKLSTNDVCNIKSCIETLEDAKINEARFDADIGKNLLDLGKCGLHIMHNTFKGGENTSAWDIKKLLSVICEIFCGSPSYQADYEKLKSTSLRDYLLAFCFVLINGQRVTI